MKWTFVAAIVVLASRVAQADPYNGNELLEYCSAREDFKQMFCLGLTTGYFEAMQANYNCQVGKHVSNGQAKDIVVKFLRENPEVRDIPAVVLASRAFVVSFGCKKPQ